MADTSPAAPVEIFDSLPYYDNELEQYPLLKQKVEQELARQPKPPATLHPRVPPPYELFTVCALSFKCSIYGLNASSIFQKNPLLQAELERVESHQPFPSLDNIRYQLPGPSSSPGTPEEWDAALKNARAQLEHQRIRCVALAHTIGRSLTESCVLQANQLNLAANIWPQCVENTQLSSRRNCETV